MVNAAGRNALITSLMVCCGFFICWTPNETIVFTSYIIDTVDFRSSMYQFSVVLMEANSCINAFIYAAKYREFQDGVRRLMSVLCNRVDHQGSNQNEGHDMANFARRDYGGAVGGTSGSTDTPAVTTMTPM